MRELEDMRLRASVKPGGLAVDVVSALSHGGNVSSHGENGCGANAALQGTKGEGGGREERVCGKRKCE